jgi:hypothetical protein
MGIYAPRSGLGGIGGEALMKRRLFLFLTALLFLSAGEKPDRPNFVLITIDTWRADYLSASGSGRVQTPFLDGLAKEGSYLKRVDAPTPLTTPSHASILTGLYPKNHGIRDNSHFRLRESVRTMAQLFKEEGYRTIAVVSAAPLRDTYGLDRGFDVYDDQDIGVEGDEAIAPSSREGRASAERALRCANGAVNQSLFIWLHLYDPHFPYTPPSPFSDRYAADPYAGEVAYVDKVLGDFVKALRASRKGRWTVLVTGDHGEGLGENSEMTHGILLYKQTREVPLILWDSEKRPAAFGSGPKSLVDILPTVVELFSLRLCKGDGVSLFRSTSNSRWLFSETLCPSTEFGLNPGLSARRDDEIYIQHGTSFEVYREPDEGRNLIGAESRFAASADAETKRFFGEDLSPPSNLQLSDEELKSLESLGYVASSAAGRRKMSACDLREFSRDFWKYYNRGEMDRSKGTLDDALSCYGFLAKRYPNSPVFHLRVGYVLVMMGRFGEAKEEFATCVRLDPRNSDGLINLGNFMREERNFKAAEQFYLSAVSCERGKARAHYNLGMLYADDLKNGRLAAEHLRRFLELAPHAPERATAESTLNALSPK